MLRVIKDFSFLLFIVVTSSLSPKDYYTYFPRVGKKMKTISVT